MPKIIYVEHSGKRTELEVPAGETVMRAALDKGVRGIAADCGGCMTCATCHVYVAPEWLDIVGKAPPEEEEMLEIAIDPRPNSRLSCQIVAEDRFDGLVLNLPKNQF